MCNVQCLLVANDWHIFGHEALEASALVSFYGGGLIGMTFRSFDCCNCMPKVSMQPMDFYHVNWLPSVLVLPFQTSFFHFRIDFVSCLRQSEVMLLF